jgi:hypothetical protein
MVPKPGDGARNHAEHRGLAPRRPFDRGPRSSAPAQAARCVAVIAMHRARIRASADPPLKPNQPTHSNPVPITASDRSNGARFSLP